MSGFGVLLTLSQATAGRPEVGADFPVDFAARAPSTLAR
jgi:hypothetical protein